MIKQMTTKSIIYLALMMALLLMALVTNDFMTSRLFASFSLIAAVISFQNLSTQIK